MLAETLLTIMKTNSCPPCVPADTMTGREYFLLFWVAIGFLIVGLLRGHRQLKNHKAEGFNQGREDAFKVVLEKFDDKARHEHMLTVLTVLSDMTGGHISLPKSKDGFENVWREVEFRYRHWVKKGQESSWKEPPPVEVKDAN